MTTSDYVSIYGVLRHDDWLKLREFLSAQQFKETDWCLFTKPESNSHLDYGPADPPVQGWVDF